MPAALGISISGDLPFLFAGRGLIAAKLPTTSPGLKVGLRAMTPVETDPGVCGFCGGELLQARNAPRVDVDETGVRIERDRHRVGPARRKDFDLLARQEVLVDAGQDRTAAVLVDVRRPVDLDEGVRGNRFAIGAVQHVHEAVLVGLDHHLAGLAADLEVGEHGFVGAVDVVHVIGRVLIDSRRALRSSAGSPACSTCRDCPTPRGSRGS